MAIIRYQRCRACGHLDRCEIFNDNGLIKAFCVNSLNCRKRIEQQKKGRPKGSKNK